MSPVPKVPESVQVTPDSLKSPVKDLLKSHGFSLNSIFTGNTTYVSDMRPPPDCRIPHTQSLADDSSHCPDEDWEEDSHDPEQLGRAEKRKMFLLGLRNLVRELQHAPVGEVLTKMVGNCR